MARRPFKHALLKHHLPGIFNSLLGVILALLILFAAYSCPSKGQTEAFCSSGIILIVILAILFLPRQMRHMWHTIEHSDIIYYLLAIAVTISLLVYLPLEGLMRVLAAIAAFVAMVLLKRVVDRIFK
jgi:hypothetical protein